MTKYIQLDCEKTLLSWEPEGIKRFCKDNCIEFKLSANYPAYGCRDAASKRYNGTGRGIPLYRELKTLLCVGKSDTQQILFAAHMSAARSANFKNIKKALGLSKNGDVNLADENILNALGMRLGTVNPFSLAVKTNQIIIQIFDSNLIDIKYSMFTNAGTLTSGIEFNIEDLIKSIKSAQLFNISKERNEFLK